MEEDGGANIYEDLPDFRFDKTLDQLNASIAKLEAENYALQNRLVEVIEEKNVLEANCRVLNTNISSLLKTAKLEIKRKERTIVDLREQLNKVMPPKRQFGTKRRRETIVPPSPRKKAKFSPRKFPESRKLSPRKIREERTQSRLKDTRSNSKHEIGEVSKSAERASTDRIVSDGRPERRDRLVAGKENAPLKTSLVTKGPEGNVSTAAPCKNLADSSPTTAVPVPPVLQCPTVFSVRMLNRLYGKEREGPLPPLAENPSGSTQSIQPSVVGEPRNAPRVSDLHPPGSSFQRPSSSTCSRVTAEDIRIYLGMEDSLNTDSSESTVSISLEVKPVATSYVEPRNVDGYTANVDATSYVKPLSVNAVIHSKGTEAGVQHQKHGGLPLETAEVLIHQLPNAIPSIPSEDKPNHLKQAELSVKKHEVPIHPRPSVENHSVSAAPPEHKKPAVLSLEKSLLPILQPPAVKSHSDSTLPKDISTEVRSEECHTKSPPAKIGLLAVGKPRQQMVAAVRPIQKPAAQGVPAVVEKLEQNKLVEHESKLTNENSPEPKPKMTDAGVRNAEKSSRLLKIPGLAGSAKGRIARQVFAPISNQWNHSHLGAINQNVSDKNCGSELSIVKSVSVTSELTVRVEDLKLDGLKKQMSAEALFGSPVKWADDSLDSPMTEESANSRRLYSIFGSPLKSVDSNSSEHQFSVPPAAYEDSCWTNQVPEKMPPHSSAGEANLQSQKGQEPGGETKSKDKILEQNDAEKVTSRSFFPPPPSSVIKKHVSIFSPVKDSKLSVSSHFPDEPSRSNTGICFPFPRPKYEDSVLGQFDDTAQFVSALAKVDKQISPLSTPVKSGEESIQPQSVIVGKNPPTSFQQVFKKAVPDGTPKIHDPQNVGKGTVATLSSDTPNSSPLSKGPSNEEHAAGTRNVSALSRNSHEDGMTSDKNVAIDCAENLKLQKNVEPPKITVTPPKTESPVRLIHRPNFASSTMLCVKSWFPNAPAKMVTPRKTPRLVSRVSRSASPKGFENSAGARVRVHAINDAFIIEQEERVRRWELDLYENTRSGSCSPIKSVNGSPIRKRIESPGKISPPKRSPKKLTGPCKSPKRPALGRDVGVEPTLPCIVPAASDGASNENAPGNQAVPCSASQTDPTASVISSQIPIVPVNSVPNTTQKVLTMIDSLITKTKNSEPGFETSSADAIKPEADVAPIVGTSVVFESRDEHKAVVAGNTKSSGCSGLEPSSKSTVERDILPSQGAASNHTPCSNSEVKESLPATVEKALLVNPPDPAASCRIPSPPTPLSFINISETDATLKENAPESSRLGSADTPGSSNVTVTKPSKSVPNRPKSSTKKKSNGNKKEPNAIENQNDSAASTDGPTPTLPDQATCKGEPIGRKVSNSSKYAAIISRVKPSTPLNKAVAALVSSSVRYQSPAPTRPRRTVTPIMPSTKNSCFKRSSALKSDAEKGAGNNPISSTRSTLFQGTPTSSVRAGNSGTKTSTLKVQPRLVRRKSEPTLVETSTNTVPVKSPSPNPVAAPSLIKCPTARAVVSRGPAKTVATDRAALSAAAACTVAHYDLALSKTTVKSVRDSAAPSKKPAEKEHITPVHWKLHEVDHQTKPISLLQRFYPLDSIRREKLDAHTDESKIVTDTISSSAQAPVLSGTVESKIVKDTVSTAHSPVIKGTVKRTGQETQRMAKSDRVQVVSRRGVEFPPKSPVFPARSRKTILLDSPLKIETPVKKRRWDSVESTESKEKRGVPKSEEAKKTRTGRVTPDDKSPKKSCQVPAEPRRSRIDWPRKSRSSRHKSRDYRSRDRSPSMSPRRSRRKSRYVSPEPRPKSCSTRHHSPGQSPSRKSSRSLDRKSKISAKELPGGRSKAGKQGSSERKPPASESAGELIANSSAESVAQRRKGSAQSSKNISSETADNNPDISRSESANDSPVFQIASAPQQKTAEQSAASDPQQTASIVDSNPSRAETAHAHNSEALRYAEFRASAAISSSTPRIQPNATNSRPGPALVIPGNRRLNFSRASASRQTQIVISAGKRPALFSRSS